MNELLLTLPANEKPALGNVRCMPGLFAAEENNLLYVKGVYADGDIDIQIRQLPVLHTYVLNEQDLLFPLDGKTPIGKLQALEWQRLSEFIQPELPVAALPGNIAGKIPIKLIQSQNAQAGAAILTTLEAWQEYAASAPEARLQCTRFAVSETGEVLIIGSPLPPVKGCEFWMVNNMLIPAGYAFELPVMYQLAAELLNTTGDNFLLFREDGQYEKIHTSNFVPSSRSGIRLTNAQIIPA